VNRERLLFVAVLAILALWFFLRGSVEPVTSVKAPVKELVRGPIKGVDFAPVSLSEAADIIQRPTNVRPHPRPVEALEKPKPFDLPNLWPPTSRSVRIDRLDLLRRDAAAPQPGPATVQLPAMAGGTAAGGPEASSAEDRIDTWKSKGVDQKGSVQEIFVTGSGWLKEPASPWPYGKEVLAKKWTFLRELVRLEDPERATADGVKEVKAASRKMSFTQNYPDDINAFQIAVGGKQQGYIRGLKRYLPVAEGNAFQPRIRAGLDLLDEGLKATSGDQRKDLLKWSLAILDEARGLVAAGQQNEHRQILLAMLKAAGTLNDYETVLRLAIDHLNVFPGESEVLERVGDVLASRTFSLTPFAIKWYQLASDRASAQRSLIAALVSEGRFDEAHALIAAGRAGTPGPEQDLLKARVALALADFPAATALAERHATGEGEVAAEAHQILGGVAYGSGDAATAAQEFEKAAIADPGRSTAYSDWGLALAVQGKTEDALLCFARALDLDRIDNAVAPEIGRGYLKLAAGEAALRAAADADDAARRDPRAAAEKAEEAQRSRSTAKEEFAAAAEMLAALKESYPSDLLVRYMLGYAKERTGNLEEAAELYRATIDGDSRYRIAIARLGLVQAQRVLNGGAKELVPAAIAHLAKAVELSKQEAILPYVFARFLMATGEDLALADRMFERAGKLPVTERNGNLPLWADLGRACLAYADEKEDVLTAKRMLNALLERIREKMPGGTTPQKAMEHEVYRAATIDLQIIEDNERKVDRIWDFTTLTKEPADWAKLLKSPMEMHWEIGKGLVFGGTINYAGKGRDSARTVLEACSMEYKSKDDLNGGSFWELVVTGVVPPTGDDPAELGIGLVNPLKGEQVQGVQVKRKRTGNVEVKVEGGDRPVFKQVKSDWVELKNVPWPAGQFRLRLEVEPEYGLARRRQGRFRLYLNDEEVFLKEFDDQPGERANVFTSSRASQLVYLYLWVEGHDGAEIKGIEVATVELTVEKK